MGAPPGAPLAPAPEPDAEPAAELDAAAALEADPAEPAPEPAAPGTAEGCANSYTSTKRGAAASGVYTTFSCSVQRKTTHRQESVH